MTASRARRLRTAVAVVFGVSLAGWAVGWSSARAQSSQSGTPSSGTAVQQPAPAQQPAATETPEMDTHEAPVPLRASAAIVVPVRVVVRDAAGHAVSTLQKDDFQVFEDGKPQVISNFVVETASASQRMPQTSANTDQTKPAETQPAGFMPPSRFVAMLFDDAHLDLQDLMSARIATEKYLQNSTAPTDRIAVYTVSGLGQIDFTDDRAKLRAALNGLQPRPTMGGVPGDFENECPPMTYYEADQIENKNDDQAFAVAIADILVCDPEFAQTNSSTAATSSSTSGQASAVIISRAHAAVQAAAIRVDEEGSIQVQAVFRSLKTIERRLATMPGQRNLVLISPGFIYPDDTAEFSEVVDQAIRDNVFVNTLDARGVYTPDMGDISKRFNEPNPSAAGLRSSWRLIGQAQSSEVLNYLADDTGGHAFHGSNDLSEGLRQVSGAPEAYYYLAFAPAKAKFDGKYHSLKVTLRGKPKLTVQSRRGYYAPIRGGTPLDVAKQDIEEAVFSQEEQHGLPVVLQTQYYKTDAENAKLSVLARLDLAHMRFDKTNGRNQNDVTIVAALFDRNGNFITGSQKVVQMKLRDETLQKLSSGGVTVRTNFDVKPGDYVVRLVVRDSNAAQLSAENGVVQIPY